ncbi:hypothetical protein L227DRAFT_436510 [Lentinus tigrinus ALCF2SS1-6]|uniref:Uncharacterized protein n=1 Tax=Lentinus tigrinus ALCF2SS1-6 TaxID=1328759 RepID=A0A5C2SHN6_9APHY|nr:hypothetical protein L227DRAFT_436510 [Lentinus tigrinus ALCF2SS1-6]
MPMLLIHGSLLHLWIAPESTRLGHGARLPSHCTFRRTQHTVSYCSSTLKLDRPPALGLDYARRHLLILTPSGVDNDHSSTLFFEYAVPESFRVGPVRRSSRTGLPTRLRGSCLARQPPRSTWAYTSREGTRRRSRASTAAALWVYCAFLRRAQESAVCDTTRHDARTLPSDADYSACLRCGNSRIYICSSYHLRIYLHIARTTSTSISYISQKPVAHITHCSSSGEYMFLFYSV